MRSADNRAGRLRSLAELYRQVAADFEAWAEELEAEPDPAAERAEAWAEEVDLALRREVERGGEEPE